MRQGRILVVNPNSNKGVTEAMSRALDPLRVEGGPAIDCMTLEEGPYGVESQADVERVALPLRRVVSEEKADAYVIACYSDPGLHVCREATEKPVFGIAESGMLAALARGDRFGVIAILARSIPRHLRYIRQTGLMARFAGDRALELRVHELADESVTWRRMVEVGGRLKAEDGADVVILGCAGMAAYRPRLEAELGIPVIDPTQAAVTQAMGAVLLA